ncbi:PadR family transcriptional regulator [Edaphobacter flagellatus]|uniref:PadR family transcriptional regulator n=1 Tax=Edaphobacter flagellatus TaxID=1933044 RepID=UPI0021B2BAFF|nr:PadR family transcriptional regulator [Edaphobacter flagellatus]
MKIKSSKRSPVGLAVLTMLYEAPMHPYRMQQLIKERGKDEVINVGQRASLYQTINRLERDGLIVARRVTREENRPERTVYELTAMGEQAMFEWMRQILSTPSKDFPEFPAALSFLPVLTPSDAQRQLVQRVVALEAELKRIDDELAKVTFLPRLFLLEIELLRESLVTELKWVRSVVSDLRSGKLTWSKAWLHKMAAEFGSQHGETE